MEEPRSYRDPSVILVVVLALSVAALGIMAAILTLIAGDDMAPPPDSKALHGAPAAPTQRVASGDLASAGAVLEYLEADPRRI